MIEYIILILIACFSGFILYSNIKKSIKGEDGCGCGCSNCSHKCSLKSEDK